LTFDLLCDPCIRVRLPTGERTALTLPGVFGRLAVDDVVSFDGLRVHQRTAWHAFLVQVAAMTLGGRGPAAIPADEGWWAAALLALGGGAPTAWTLVEGDLARPAFLQPPVPEGSVEGFDDIDTPDGLDVLVTSKNHEGKVDRMRYPSPDHWVYALVALQTTQGFSGKMNYGIARMNSGFGSRALVGVTPGTGWGPRFRRDVRVAIDARPDLCRTYGFVEQGGIRLAWILPWDGTPTSALSLAACDPLCVEVCRRVRLLASGTVLYARTRSTESARIACVKGVPNPADPWMPVRIEDGSPLTLSEQGFTYAKTQDLLFGGDYRRSAAQEVRTDDGPSPRWSATALVRGQGKTGGLHSREILIPPAARRQLASVDGVQTLGRLAKAQVDRASLVRRKVLRPPLLVLLQSAPKALNFQDDRTERWLDQYESSVNASFFSTLWERSDKVADDVVWDRRLLDAAGTALKAAIEDCPIPSVHRYRAIATAETLFSRLARKHLDERAFKFSEGGTDVR